MTESQTTTFRKILDTNWEIKELYESGKWMESISKMNELTKLKEELKGDMGEEEYNKFIETGRKMFAPIE